MNKIKNLREENNITQEELAKKLNLSSKGIISMYEKEDRKPSLDVLIKMAEIFNCSIDYILGLTDKKNSDEDIQFAYSKDTKGLSEQEIKEAIEFYRKIKYGNGGEK